MPTFNNGESGASVREKINEAINKVESIETSLVNINAKLDALTIPPSYLFANGEQGAWYDPSDLTTLYQDAAGTTPVTAVGDPVGLMLDKSQGPKLGPELVTNGTFDTDTDWALDDDVAITGGELSSTKPDSGTVAYQSINFVAGKSYRVEFDYTNPEGVVLVPRFAGGSDVTGPSIGSGGRYSAVMVAASGNTKFQWNVTSAGFTGVIDNVSVRELPGNHATQSTAARRPVYRTDGTLHWLEFDGVDDAFEVLGADLSGQSSVFAAINGDSSIDGPRLFVYDTGIQDFSGWRRVNTAEIRFEEASNFETTQPAGNYVLGELLDEGNPARVRLSGVEQSPVGLSGNVSGTGFVIANRGNLDGASTVDYYGFLAINRLLSSSEIASLEAYLASKSGVTL